jgi:hypothetical protein
MAMKVVAKFCAYHTLNVDTDDEQKAKEAVNEYLNALYYAQDPEDAGSDIAEVRDSGSGCTKVWFTDVSEKER